MVWARQKRRIRIMLNTLLGRYVIKRIHIMRAQSLVAHTTVNGSRVRFNLSCTYLDVNDYFRHKCPSENRSTRTFSYSLHSYLTDFLNSGRAKTIIGTKLLLKINITNHKAVL